MSRPTIRERAAAKLCPNCGAPSAPRRSPKGPAPLYCSPECKKALGNRYLRDGLALVAFVKAWRVDRATGEIAKKSFERMCVIADMLNAEDREAGRPRADYHAAVILRDQFHTVEEQRYGRRKVAEARKRAAENIAMMA